MGVYIMEKSDIEKDYFLYIGRLVEKKGLTYLIKAFKGLDFKLKIAGTGPLRNELGEEAKDYDNIEFLGYISDYFKKQLIREAKAVIIPSIVDSTGNTEGVPVVLLEALSSGKMVIATKVGGIPEIVKDGYNGILVKPKSVSSLRNAAKQIILGGDYNTIKENAYEAVRSLSWKEVSKNYFDIMESKTKICIISSQIAGFEKIGGFATMTKKLAEGLANKGYDVSVVVPKVEKQKDLEIKNNVKVYGLGKFELLSTNVFRKIDADIYHSQNPNISTFIAMIAQPKKKHVITCRDPRSNQDWETEFEYATWSRRISMPFIYLYHNNPFVSYAIRKADIVGCPAIFLKEKVRKLYGREDVIFLPNLEKVPANILGKSANPTVCYVGRLDKRKRPELVFELAEKFPDVSFLVAGKAEDSGWERILEEKAKKIRNVNFLKCLSGEKLSRTYSSSWVLINTAVREGLPLAFIEAASNGCAILSKVNPDDFTSKFGYCCKDDNFEKGLQKLIKGNVWRKKGKKAHNYVKSAYEEEKSLKKHIDIYNQILERQK
jgi:glycosyltransferase involved in cell wall biosynthesis